MFAGQSGAGKSTVARLFAPLQILSDEASLVKVCGDQIKVLNSPFRSELKTRNEMSIRQLAGIHILSQSDGVQRVLIKKSDAVLQLMKVVFYWDHDREETANVLQMCQKVAQSVPVFQLFFQKNNSFWESIQ